MLFKIPFNLKCCQQGCKDAKKWLVSLSVVISVIILLIIVSKNTILMFIFINTIIISNVIQINKIIKLDAL